MAAEDDCLDIIASILQPRQQEEENQEQQQAAEAQEQPVESSDEEQPVQSNHSSSSSKSTAAVSASTSESIKSSSKASKPKAPDKEVVKYFRKRISAMKSFVESSHRWVAGWAEGVCGERLGAAVTRHQGVPSTSCLL